MNNVVASRNAPPREEEKPDKPVVGGQVRRRNRTLEQAVKLLEALQVAAAL
jgi:hypothetical protein